MKLTINGTSHEIEAEWQNESLLDVLRDHLGLTGTRFSCGIGLCGACLVHLDGVPTNSCLLPVQTALGKDVLTIEGLAEPDGSLHPVQQVWVDEAVPQCGYCQSGQIIRAVSLLERNPRPNEADIDAAMDGHLCRCGTYPRIKQSIKKASLVMQGLEE